MDCQEIFDKVNEHFFQQEVPATDELGTCSYRTAEGNKCAVGVLIPDNEYTPSMERETVAGIVTLVPSLQSVASDSKELLLLRRLQRIHDLTAMRREKLNGTQTQSEMRLAAQEFNLEYKIT